MYNLKDIIASTSCVDVHEVNLNITNDFESMEIYEDLFESVENHYKNTYTIKEKVEEIANKSTEDDEEELNLDDFIS